MKKITVLAIEKEISIFFQRELNKIFDEMFEIDYRHVDMEPIPPIYNTDLILYTDPEILNKLIHIIKCDAPTLMMKRTITREALKKIKKIPSGSRALVTNINQYMANETMALIYQLGVTDIQLFPYYEGKDNLPDNIDYIIVPEPEPYDFLPDNGAEVLLIGNRVFDISNVLDILSLMRMDNSKSEEIIKKYLLKVPTFWYGFEYAWQNRRVLLSQWKLLLDEMGSGVMVTDGEGRIELLNDRAQKILDIKKERLEGQFLREILHMEPELKFLLSKEEKSEELTQIKGQDIVLTIKKVEFNNDYYGKIIIFRPYNEMVEVQQKIHKKLVGEGHHSRYQFSDLVGEAPSFLQAKKIAKKVSTSDSTILLLGDSGTGKEMFAGAIHNYSHRSPQPFVAVNCATLPENLLESELFGYEKGAFTGARRGGKIGLFERADGGTIFLDEIGDMPIKLQARLLRALEEKEIMRVGGNSIIKVNVRVIAATNRDLLKQVKEGDFRKDLFYRLNVFQIKLPSLADRKEDIGLLIKHFLHNWERKREVCGDFKIFASNYNWPGNVRELRNTLEYMTTISSRALSFASLPTYLKKREYYLDQKHDGRYLLLKILYYLCKNDKDSGRRSLTDMFNKIYYDISEMEIREMIEKLSENNLLNVRRGRAGTVITKKGVNRLKEMEFTGDNPEIFNKE
ncbi:MAG: sigma 54-interacting transcriptional regulator [Halanaerobiales bacterium]